MTRARYSIPYFVSPEGPTVVECLPSCTDERHPAKYGPIKWNDYMLMRASMQYDEQPKEVEVASWVQYREAKLHDIEWENALWQSKTLSWNSFACRCWAFPMIPRKSSYMRAQASSICLPLGNARQKTTYSREAELRGCTQKDINRRDFGWGFGSAGMNMQIWILRRMIFPQ